jgi:hypothetical protein
LPLDWAQCSTNEHCAVEVHFPQVVERGTRQRVADYLRLDARLRQRSAKIRACRFAAFTMSG